MGQIWSSEELIISKISELIEFPVELGEIEIQVELVSGFTPEPGFTLNVKGTGEVEFQWDHVLPVPDVELPNLSRDQIIELLEALFDINFFEMADRYAEKSIFEMLPDGRVDRSEIWMTDLPRKVFKVRLGKVGKEVIAYLGYPKRLDTFYELLLSITEAIEVANVDKYSGNA